MVVRIQHRDSSGNITSKTGVRAWISFEICKHLTETISESIMPFELCTFKKLAQLRNMHTWIWWNLFFPRWTFPESARVWRSAPWRTLLSRVLDHHGDGELLLRPRHWSRHHLRQKKLRTHFIQQDSYRELWRLWLSSLAVSTNTRTAWSFPFNIQQQVRCKGVLRVGGMDRGSGGLESPRAWRRRVGWYKRLSTRRMSSPNLVGDWR